MPIWGCWRVFAPLALSATSCRRILTGSFDLTWPEAQHHFIGRSDDVVKLRGTNLYPMACLSAIKAEEGTVGERPCVVDRVGKVRRLLDRRYQRAGGER